MATRIRFTRYEKKDDKCDDDSQERKFICETLIPSQRLICGLLVV